MLSLPKELLHLIGRHCSMQDVLSLESTCSGIQSRLKDYPHEQHMALEICEEFSKPAQYDYGFFALGNDAGLTLSSHWSQASYLQEQLTNYLQSLSLTSHALKIIYLQFSEALKKSPQAWIKGFYYKASSVDQHESVLRIIALLPNMPELCNFLMGFCKYCHVDIDAQNNFKNTVLTKMLAQENHLAIALLAKYGVSYQRSQSLR